jgi:hypothetical protein
MINKKLLLLCIGLLMTTQMIFSQVPSYVPTNGLVGYWPFNGNANDQTPNGNNGTVNGASLTNDRFGNVDIAYDFDGISNYITVLDNNVFNMQNFTISTWVKNSSTAPTVLARYILNKGCNTPSPSFRLYYENDGTLQQYVSDCWVPNRVYLNGPSSNNLWVNLIYSYDGQNLKMYVDGVLYGTTNQSGSLTNNNNPMYIGCSTATSNCPQLSAFYAGKIDDIGIWNRALSQQEITNMYNGVNYSDTCNAVSGSLVNGLVAYYPFCGNANDQSGNGLNGVVNGAILTSDRFGNSNSAYVFDGNSKIRCAFSNQFSPDASDNYSFSFWAENTSNNFGMILQYYTYNPTENISNYDFFNSLPSCPSGSYAFQNFPFNSPGGCSPTLVNLNEWNHIVVVIKQVEQTFNVFKNGVFWFNGNVGNIKPYAGFLTIGNVISDTFGYNGKIDDIGIWNRALIPQEITQLYNQNQCVTNITVTDTLIINVGQLSYTNPVTYANNITIYPNPANTQVNISFNNITDLTGGNINIVNSLGQQVATTPITLSGTNTNMQLNSWGGTGLYFVQILNAQGIVVDVKKIILQ